MKINVEGDTEIGAYFVSFTHVRKGRNYHAYIRMDDIKSFENDIESQDRATRWRLETNSGDIYYTLNSFMELMDTNSWHPKRREGSKSGFVMRELLYRPTETVQPRRELNTALEAGS
jgi:hypothetical protein